MKIAYAGIDLFYPALEALTGSGCEIIKIYTCETDNETEFNVRVIATAKQHKIPYTTARIRMEDISWLKSQGCEALICAGYYYRIPVDQDLYMVNIHPSLLPVGRGSWPMPQTILQELPESGVTIHKMAKQFDTGDILLQESFPVAKDETLETFMAKIHRLLPGMVLRLLADFESLYANARPQGPGEYWKAPKEKDWTVDDSMDMEQIDKILRAFYGYDCIYKTGNKTYRLLRARTAVNKEGDGIYLPLNDGYIKADYAEEL